MNLTFSYILWTVHSLYSFSVSQAMETQTFSVSALGAMLIDIRFIVFVTRHRSRIYESRSQMAGRIKVCLRIRNRALRSTRHSRFQQRPQSNGNATDGDGRLHGHWCDQYSEESPPKSAGLSCSDRSWTRRRLPSNLSQNPPALHPNGTNLSEHQVQRAIHLSQETYCAASIIMGRSGAEVTHSYEIMAESQEDKASWFWKVNEIVLHQLPALSLFISMIFSTKRVEQILDDSWYAPSGNLV